MLPYFFFCFIVLRLCCHPTDSFTLRFSLLTHLPKIFSGYSSKTGLKQQISTDFFSIFHSIYLREIGKTQSMCIWIINSIFNHGKMILNWFALIISFHSIILLGLPSRENVSQLNRFVFSFHSIDVNCTLCGSIDIVSARRCEGIVLLAVVPNSTCTLLHVVWLLLKTERTFRVPLHILRTCNFLVDTVFFVTSDASHRTNSIHARTARTKKK